MSVSDIQFIILAVAIISGLCFIFKLTGDTK